MSENVFVTVVLVAQDGKAEELVSIVRELAGPSRLEAGAVEYGFVQDRGNPNVVVAREEWKTAEDEAAHWQTPHVKAALEKLGRVLGAEPQIFKGAKVV